MTYVLPLFYLSSLITMFSRYYMSLFLILIFFSFLFFFVLVFCRIVKSDDSVTEIIHIYLYKKQAKNLTESPILVPLRPLTITIKLIGFQHIRNVIKYVKLYGNQMSTKVVTCIS